MLLILHEGLAYSVGHIKTPLILVVTCLLVAFQLSCRKSVESGPSVFYLILSSHSLCIECCRWALISLSVIEMSWIQGQITCSEIIFIHCGNRKSANCVLSIKARSSFFLLISTWVLRALYSCCNIYSFEMEIFCLIRYTASHKGSNLGALQKSCQL